MVEPGSATGTGRKHVAATYTPWPWMIEIVREGPVVKGNLLF